MSEEVDMVTEEQLQAYTVYRWSMRGRYDRWALGMSRKAKRKYVKAGVILGLLLGALLAYVAWGLLWGW